MDSTGFPSFVYNIPRLVLGSLPLIVVGEEESLLMDACADIMN
jgi:hypothetical protein